MWAARLVEVPRAEQRRPTVDEALAASRPRVRPQHLWLVVVAIGVALSASDTGLTPGVLVAWVPAFGRFVADMWPPDFTGPGGLVRASLFTVEVAVMGTLLATVASAPMAVLGARNLTPHPAMLTAVRLVVLVCRAVPDFVFALMLIAALGLGPLPGVLGLALHSIGMLGKVYAERIEEIDPGPPEALEAMGARRLQVIRLAVLPQVVPNLVANTLYRLDINIRSSIVLGLVGAGGIGYELITAIQGLAYRRAMAVMLVVLVLVVVVEAVSNRIRKGYL